MRGIFRNAKDLFCRAERSIADASLGNGTKRSMKHRRRVDEQGMIVDRVTGERVPAFKGMELTGKQMRFATRVQVKMGECMLHNVHLKTNLLDRNGFTVLEVRMSPDLRKAFIRWTCWQGMEKETEMALQNTSSRLRQCLSKSLGARFVPSLEFRREGDLSEKQMKLEEAFQRAAQEREAWEKRNASVEERTVPDG